MSVQEDPVYSRDPSDVNEVATAFPSEDDAIGNDKNPEQTRRAIIRIHTNLGHPQNSTLAQMISDAVGSDEMIKCATRYPWSVCRRVSPVSVVLSQFRELDSSMIPCWPMCISGITKVVRCLCTR